MASVKIIGKVEVISGDVKIVGVDGVVRDVSSDPSVYEGEQVVSIDSTSFFNIKYSALPEATEHRGLFRLLSNGSAVTGDEAFESIVSDRNLMEILETAAGAGEADANSGYYPYEVVAESNVQEFYRGENATVDRLEGIEIGAITSELVGTEEEGVFVNSPPVAISESITKIADHEIIKMDVKTIDSINVNGEDQVPRTYVYEDDGWYGVKDYGSPSHGEDQGEDFNGQPMIDSHDTPMLDGMYQENEGIRFVFTNSLTKVSLEFKNVGDNTAGNDNILVELYKDGEQLDVSIDTSGIEQHTSFVIEGYGNFDEVRVTALDYYGDNGNSPTEFRISSVVVADMDRDWVLPFVIDDSMLLANDTDIDGDSLRVELVDGNLYASDGTTIIGSVSIITTGDSAGDIQVTPDPINDFETHTAEYGNFAYVVVDENGLSSESTTATIDVAVGEIVNNDVGYVPSESESIVDDFIIGTDSDIDTNEVLSSNTLTVQGTLDLSHVSDINTIDLDADARVIGSSDFGHINPGDVMNATDVDNILVIHSVEGLDAPEVDVHDSFGDASTHVGGTTLESMDVEAGLEGIFYNHYNFDGVSLLIEIDPPIDAVES